MTFEIEIFLELQCYFKILKDGIIPDDCWQSWCLEEVVLYPQVLGILNTTGKTTGSP